MTRTSSVARLRAPVPSQTLKPVCAAVLIAYSTLSMAASQNLTADRETQQKKSAQEALLAQTTFAQATFDPSFLINTPGSNVDVKRYENGNVVIPGQYTLDTFLSGTSVGNEPVEIRVDNGRPRVCFNRALLDRLGIDLAGAQQSVLDELTDPGACVELNRVIPAATVNFDSSAMRLDVSVPQASLRHTARGSVDPRLWDSGVTALVLGYTANAFHSISSGVQTDSAYVGLNAGFNVGGWMFRHDGAFNWYRRAGDQYSDINTYVRHDLTAWKARVTIGDANTTGDVFDTFAFRGVQLATDDRMLPDSLNGYAPVIRGIAETNARVTVRQGTSVIYDQPMPPGPFVIDDLYPTGYGGNLDVTVTEADGRTRSFQVPYASVAQLLRPGQTRYSAVVGNIRNMRLTFTPHVLQAAIQRGLTNSVTLYGGALAASHYASILGGSAVSTPIGAIALDLSAAQTAAPAQTMRGVSVRVTYSKLFTATSSNLSVAAYRFSSSGYFDLNGAMTYVDAGRSGFANPAGAVNWRARNRLSIMLSQPLGDIWGNLFFSGFTQDYWTRSGTDTQFQAGYNNHYRSVGYSVSINRTRTGNGQMDMQYMLALTLPLGHTSHAPTMSMNLMQDSSGGMSAQAVVNGQAGTDNQFGYSVEGSRNSDRTYDGSVSGQYRSPYTSISAMAGGGTRYSSESLGLTGSVVVHPGGITASPYVADTIAIVAAPAAAGAAVESYPGVRLDPRGYAVVPYLTPYRINEVTLSPAGLSDDVELEVTSEQAVPRYGAIVMLRYPTISGRPVLIRSSLPDGQPLPFGSSVFDEKGKAVGTVTQGGQIYARLNSKHERLTLKYGPADALQCTIDVTLDDPTPRTGPIRYMRLQARCVPGESHSPSHETPTAAVQGANDAPQ